MAWVEYPAQTRTGNYVNARYDPATGQVQANKGGDWIDIGVTQGSSDSMRPSDPQWSWAMPSAQQVWTMKLAQQQQQGEQTPTGAAPAAQRSYFGQAPMIQQGGAPMPVGGAGTAQRAAAAGGVGGGSTMTWRDVGLKFQLPQVILDQWAQQGWSPAEIYQGYATTGAPPTGVPASKQAAAAAPPPPPPIGSSVQPETTALGQMAQIDPASEALRTSLGQSYLSTLSGAPTPVDPSKAVAPSAADVQSYLDLYKKIDPQGYAQRVSMAGGVDQFVKQAQQEAALGSTLDASTQREVEQATRAGQVARGNVYGTPQLVAEAMARGSAGEARRQQRQQALAGALGMQQSYLSSGQGLGDIANTLYQQGFARNLNTFQAQQAARQAAQQGALSYLGSGQTPYQAGSSYLTQAENRAASAAQGGPVYQPQGPSPYYTGQGTSSFPQYGIDMSQLANQWYNSMNAYNQVTPQKNRTGAALGGAASGALSGAAAGTAITPGIGTVIGGIGGAVLGGAGGYFS